MKKCIFVCLFLTGCAANLQGVPKLVGVQDGISPYSIDGYTNWGDTKKTDAERYAKGYAQYFCGTEPNILRIETTAARNLAGAEFLRWMAIYNCR